MAQTALTTLSPDLIRATIDLAKRYSTSDFFRQRFNENFLSKPIATYRFGTTEWSLKRILAVMAQTSPRFRQAIHLPRGSYDQAELDLFEKLCEDFWEKPDGASYLAYRFRRQPELLSAKTHEDLVKISELPDKTQRAEKAQEFFSNPKNTLQSSSSSPFKEQAPTALAGEVREVTKQAEPAVTTAPQPTSESLPSLATTTSPKGSLEFQQTAHLGEDPHKLPETPENLKIKQDLLKDWKLRHPNIEEQFYQHGPATVLRENKTLIAPTLEGDALKKVQTETKLAAAERFESLPAALHQEVQNQFNKEQQARDNFLEEGQPLPEPITTSQPASIDSGPAGPQRAESLTTAPLKEPVSTTSNIKALSPEEDKPLQTTSAFKFPPLFKDSPSILKGPATTVSGEVASEARRVALDASSGARIATQRGVAKAQNLVTPFLKQTADIAFSLLSLGSANPGGGPATGGGRGGRFSVGRFFNGGGGR